MKIASVSLAAIGPRCFRSGADGRAAGRAALRAQKPGFSHVVTAVAAWIAIKPVKRLLRPFLCVVKPETFGPTDQSATYALKMAGLEGGGQGVAILNTRILRN